MSVYSRALMNENAAKPINQSSYADRKERAQKLIQKISELRKPVALDYLGKINDAQKIIQMLFNTQHI
jgi:uncharacterized protein YjgD (DUF1641 family)